MLWYNKEKMLKKQVKYKEEKRWEIQHKHKRRDSYEKNERTGETAMVDRSNDILLYFRSRQNKECRYCPGRCSV